MGPPLLTRVAYEQRGFTETSGNSGKSEKDFYFLRHRLTKGVHTNARHRIRRKYHYLPTQKPMGLCVGLHRWWKRACGNPGIEGINFCEGTRHRTVRGLGKGFISFFFTLSDDSSLFFMNRRRNRLTGNPLHSTKPRGASLKARSAFYAFLLVNHMDLVFAAFNRLHRTSSKANPAGLALFRINIVRGYFAK